MRLAAIFLSVIFSLAACSSGEPREEKYPNGQPKSLGHVIQDKDGNFLKTGKWEEWSSNGQSEY